MSETYSESGFEERHGVTVRELLNLWEELEKLLKRIKKGDPDTFLGREQIEREFKSKNVWKEKWLTLPEEGRRLWAQKAYNSHGSTGGKTMQSYINLAEKFYKEAEELSIIESGVSKKDVSKAMVELTKKTAGEYMQELEKIGKLLNNLPEPNYRKTAKLFVQFVENFKKGPLYSSLSADEKSYFDQYSELIDLEQDSVDVLQTLLEKYIVTIQKIIRLRI